MTREEMAATLKSLTYRAGSEESSPRPDDDLELFELRTLYERQFCRLPRDEKKIEQPRPCADDAEFNQLATQTFGDRWDELRRGIERSGSYWEYLRELKTPRGWRSSVFSKTLVTKTFDTIWNRLMRDLDLQRSNTAKTGSQLLSLYQVISGKLARQDQS